MKTYLELSKGKTREFWQVEVEGETQTITSGTVGGKKPPKVQSKTLKSAKAAAESAAKEVAKKKAAFYFDPTSIEGVLEAHQAQLAIPTEAEVKAHRAALPHASEDYFRVYQTGALSLGFFSDFAPGADAPTGPLRELTGLFTAHSAADELDEDARALDPYFYVVGAYPDGSAVVLYNQGKHAGRVGLIEHGPSDDLLEHLSKDADATVDAWRKHSLIEPITELSFSDLVHALLLHHKGAAVERMKALQEALEAVREAVAGDPLEVKELDLREKSLRTLPDFLGGCRNLEKLLLGQNELKAVPPVLRALTKLRVLDLHYNGIETSALPAWLSALPLTELDLCINEKGALSPVLSEIKTLEQLRLPTLTSLPASIGALEALRSLDIDGVEGPIAEGGLARLARLETLKLGDLTVPLPADIGALKALRELKFSVTPRAGFALPDSISGLQSLRILHAGASTLNDAVCELTGLEELKVSGNAAGLPARLGALQALRKLDLNYARMHALPESVGDLRNLEVLNLESSDLKALPASFAKLTQLRWLSLNPCHFDQPFGAEAELFGLAQLEFLALSVHVLRSLRGAWSNLRNLKTLKVYSQSTETLDPALFAFVHELPALKTFGVPYELKAHFRQALPGIEVT